jgi:beta-lactam-binding protein with PASTA domain
MVRFAAAPPEMVIVPPLQGKNLAEAEGEAHRSGLIVRSDGTQTVPTRSAQLIGKTLVTGQSPAPNERVAKGTIIKIKMTTYVPAH